VDVRRTLTSLTALAALSCSAPPTPPSGECPSSTPRARVWVSTSDYNSGQLCSLATETGCTRSALDTVTSDTVLARHGERVVAMSYVLNTTDEMIVFRPGAHGALVREGAAESPRPREGETANVRGYLALDATRGLFSRNDRSSLGVLDVETRRVVGNVSLEALAMGAPRAAPYAVVAAAGRAFVTLQRWDAARLDAPRAGALAVVDPSTLALIDADPATPAVDAIELPFSNPFGQVDVRGDAILIPCAGSLRTVGDGAIVEVDARAMRVARTFADERFLRGNPLHVLSLDADRVLIVTITEPAPDDEMAVAATRLIEWSRSGEAVVRTWLDVPEFALTAPILGNDGRVYIGDRGSEAGRASGIIVFDAQTGQRLNTAPIAMGLPPYALLAAE
jgi:hypothetical protein